jgi:hypothetical protein
MFGVTLKKSLLAVILSGASFAGSARAANVTLNETGLDALYGQWSIDIRYNATQTIYNSALLSIDNDAEFGVLSTYQTSGSVISMFFVDTINFCGIALPNIVGCASVPGTLIALDSGFIASSGAAVTAMGHEIGHNLGLDHLDVNGNLMRPTTFTFDSNAMPQLTLGQRTTIVASGLVQTEQGTNQKFIQITPFLVAADAPEPATWSLLGLAFSVAAWKMRRARSV